MSSDMDRFRDDLGAELAAATYRRTVPADRSGSPRWRLSPAIGFIATGIVVVIAVVGYSIVRPTPAEAEVFVVTQIDGRFELEVIDIVTNPGEVVAQLEAELGLDSELFAVPVSEDLIGRLLVAGTSGDVIPEIVRDLDGVITRIVLIEGFNGSLIIEYGRRTKPGESYAVSLPDPACGELWGQTAAQSVVRLEQLADSIRYETEDQQGISTTGVDFEDIDPTYQLVDVTFLDPESIVVTYTADTTLRPRHPNCE